MGTAFVAFVLLQASIAGTWNGATKTAAPVQFAVKFEVSGNELTGFLTSRSLFQTVERPIKGTIDRSTVTFQEVVENAPRGTVAGVPPKPPAKGGPTPTLYVYRGEVKGDEILMTRERVGAEKPDPVPLVLKRAK